MIPIAHGPHRTLPPRHILSRSTRVAGTGMNLQSTKSLGALGQESAWFENGGPYRTHDSADFAPGSVGSRIPKMSDFGHFFDPTYPRCKVPKLSCLFLLSLPSTCLVINDSVNCFHYIIRFYYFYAYCMNTN